MLPKCDVIVINTPLTEQTRYTFKFNISVDQKSHYFTLEISSHFNFQNYYYEECIISVIHIRRNKFFDHLPEMSSNQRFLWFRGLFDKNRIAKCKKGVLIVNNARGAIADTQAIADACSSGHVAGNSKTRWQKCLCFQQQNKKLLLN